MKIRTLRAGAVAPLLAGLTVALAAPAATAAAPGVGPGTGTITTTALPLTGFASVVADTAHDHLFIAGGSQDTSLAVTDFSGNVVASIALGTRATSLALSPDRRTLYAALPDAAAVSAIDTSTLTVTTRYSVGVGVVPRYVAAIGKDVWFGYDHGSNPGSGIGHIDRRDGAVALTDVNRFGGAPRLATSPAAPGVVIAGDVSEEPTTIEEFNVASGSPVLTAETDGWSDPAGCQSLVDLAITPDGHNVVTACGAPYYAVSYNLTGLTQNATYQTGPYPHAIAIAQDGQIALAASVFYADALVFSPEVSTPTLSYNLRSDEEGDETAGLAWGEHDRQLFAVTVDVYNMNPVLSTINFDTH